MKSKKLKASPLLGKGQTDIFQISLQMRVGLTKAIEMLKKLNTQI